MQTSFSLKTSIHDERDLDSLKNIPLFGEIAKTNPVLLEKRISTFQNSSSSSIHSSQKAANSTQFQSPIHSSAKEARDDKLAKKEKKEKRKKHKSKDEDNDENEESKEERRARREKRRAEKRARKESDQKNGAESMDFDEYSGSSNGFSDVKRQKIMETSPKKPENLPQNATACTLTFDDSTKIGQVWQSF